MRSLAAVFILLAVPLAVQAQERKATQKETSAIRACAGKFGENVDQAERNCLSRLVADPCTKVKQANQDIADCYRVETEVWDALLNENYKELMKGLEDEQQRGKLRDMQKAWIANRDATCGFYWEKIQGSMAVPMGASCLMRETARRALLLKFLTGL